MMKDWKSQNFLCAEFLVKFRAIYSNRFAVDDLLGLSVSVNLNLG